MHEVATGNQLFGAQHGGDVIGLGKVALRRVAGAGHHGRNLHRVRQLVFQGLQPGRAARIRVGRGRVHIDHQMQLARQVVDHRQLFALQQQDVGAMQLVGRATGFQLFLDVAHRVVAKIARQSATKARHTGAQRHLEALLVAGNKVQRIGLRGLDHHAVGHHLGAGLGAKATTAQQGARRQANKAVAPKALATHHRLQQKRVRRVGRELEVERQRGFQVGKGLGG